MGKREKTRASPLGAFQYSLCRVVLMGVGPQLDRHHRQPTFSTRSVESF